MRLSFKSLATAGVLVSLALMTPLLAQIARGTVEEWRLDRRLAQVERERARLTEEQRRLKDDPTYVEGLIRSTFKLAKPGEVVIPLSGADLASSD
jgi:cell division protein FtsB